MRDIPVVRRVVGLSTAALLALGPARAVAEEPLQCRVVDVAFKPASRTDLTPARNPPPQIVVWVEDPAGNYLDTLYITKQTGTLGLGNRPGRFDFNSGPMWPYGRRITVFPVWAERKRHADGTPMLFDEVVFQDLNENQLSHAFTQSSREVAFCRPMLATEPAWDALTCASPSMVYTDKGRLSSTRKSKYPPREDVTRTPGIDAASVDTFAALNPFDAVSQATPAADQLAEISWPIPPDFPAGGYVMWVEVSKEFDHNDTYSTTAYPSPTGISFPDYGEAYRGQPSVLYRVPFTVDASATVAIATDYAGYGDPDGLDGEVRPPDATISTSVQGSGAARFALVPDGTGGGFRVRVTARSEVDRVLPGLPGRMEVETSSSQSATVTFVAPGDDGEIGRVKGYDIRYRIGDAVTADNFDSSLDPKLAVDVGDPGTLQTFTINGLLPETTYSIGIRAFDDCRNTSAVTVIELSTDERAIGEVDACFVATAAYGSALAADVQMLRHMRDAVLRKTVLGELAVETYYTFGPAVAGVVGESELLRASAREVLAPVVRWVRAFRF